MFARLMQFITAVYENAKTGSTGYLDRMPWVETPMKGVDEHGREFFLLPLFTTQFNRYGGEGGETHISERKGVVCFFKRFSDPSHPVWVVAESHEAGLPANPCMGGAIRNPANGDIEDLFLQLLKGETVEFDWSDDRDPDWGKFSRSSRLLTPAEVAQLKASPREQLS
jgi:hypothetical protein